MFQLINRIAPALERGITRLSSTAAPRLSKQGQPAHHQVHHDADEHVVAEAHQVEEDRLASQTGPGDSAVDDRAQWIERGEAAGC